MKSGSILELSSAAAAASPPWLDFIAPSSASVVCDSRISARKGSEPIVLTPPLAPLGEVKVSCSRRAASTAQACERTIATST